MSCFTAIFVDRFLMTAFLIKAYPLSIPKHTTNFPLKRVGLPILLPPTAVNYFYGREACDPFGKFTPAYKRRSMQEQRLLLPLQISFIPTIPGGILIFHMH